MDINEIKSALDRIPVGQSDFEFENFFLDTFPTPARQLIAVMLEIEETYNEQQQLQRQLSLGDIADVTLVERDLTRAQQKLNQLTKWYNDIPADTRNEILDNFENEEPTYWSIALGKKAAIELLTNRQTSFDTMMAMSKLPVPAFEESVRICSRYAALIRTTTESVERSIPNTLTGLAQAQ